jgi:hypothetical protein
MRLLPVLLLVCLSVSVLELARPASAALTPSERCSACDLVVDELELIFHEDARSSEQVDLRNRLNTKGKRVGKVVPYAHSEIRLFSVIERLCAAVDDRVYSHGTHKVTDLSVFYEADHQPPVFGDALQRSASAKARSKRKELAVYCSTIAEDHEDALFGWMRADKTAQEIRELLCHDRTRHCAGLPTAAPLDRSVFAFVEDVDGEIRPKPRAKPAAAAAAAAGATPVAGTASGEAPDAELAAEMEAVTAAIQAGSAEAAEALSAEAAAGTAATAADAETAAAAATAAVADASKDEL